MRIVIVPGMATSKSGHQAFVDGYLLMDFYKLERRLCMVWDPLRSKGPRPDPSWPHLYPDPTGEYKLTPEAQKVVDDDAASLPG